MTKSTYLDYIAEHHNHLDEACAEYSFRELELAYKKGQQDAEEQFKIWLEELLITNWEIEKVKEKIKELNNVNKCKEDK